MPAPAAKGPGSNQHQDKPPATRTDAPPPAAGATAAGAQASAHPFDGQPATPVNVTPGGRYVVELVDKHAGAFHNGTTAEVTVQADLQTRSGKWEVEVVDGTAGGISPGALVVIEPDRFVREAD